MNDLDKILLNQSVIMNILAAFVHDPELCQRALDLSWQSEQYATRNVKKREETP